MEPPTEITKNLDPTKIDLTGRQINQARKLLAYGGLDGVVQRPLFDNNGRVFPHFAVAAKGYSITDSTGQQFIDWVNGWGPVLLGYRHPKVEQAIVDQLSAGPTLSLMNPVEIEVAELIEEMVPCAEMIAFGKNGSDAVTAALRVARATTGREKVLQFGFHGFHDWYTCLHPEVRGITPVLRDYVDTFEYNDLPGLEKLFQKYPDQVAAVIMEPVNMWMPEPGYLQAVKDLTHRNGALLIFDELVTAFRLAPGGAQERFSVKPDLACLGKGMANGMPLSAVVGARNYMQCLPGCGFGMTFRGETLSLAAAKATLQVINDEPVNEHLNRVGSLLRSKFQSLCQDLDVPCELSGPDARMSFVFHDRNGIGWSDARDFFLQECLQHGVLTNGNLLPSYAHDDEAVEQTMVAFRAALTKLAKLYHHSQDASSISSNQSAIEVLATGFLDAGIKALNITGFVEKVEEVETGLEVIGWLLLNSGAAESIKLCSQTSHSTIVAERVYREDLLQAFSNRNNSEWAGFRASLPRMDFCDQGQFKFVIEAIDSEQPVYRCVVNVQQGNTNTGPWPLNDGVLYL